MWTGEQYKGDPRSALCSQEGVPGLLSHLPTTITSAETGVLSSSCLSTALPAGTPAAPPLSPQHSLVAPPRVQHNDPLSEGPGIPHSAWGRSVQWLLLPASGPRRLPHSSEVPAILNSGFLSGHESLGNSTRCHFGLTDQWRPHASILVPFQRDISRKLGIPKIHHTGPSFSCIGRWILYH